MNITLTGSHIVSEFLSSGHQRIKNIFLTEKCQSEERDKVCALSSRKNIPWRKMEEGLLNERFPGKRIRGGMIAELFEFPYFALEDLLPGGSEMSIVVVLDRVVDPHNVGAIARSAYAFGTDGLIIQKKRASSITEGAIDSSAGALAHLPVVRAVNLSRVVEYLKGKGYWVYGASSREGIPVHEVSFGKKIVLVLGSEGEGIREKLLSKCDVKVTIPLIRHFDSLNVSVSAGIFLHTIRKSTRPS